MTTQRIGREPQQTRGEPTARVSDRPAPDSASLPCSQWHDLASAVQRKSAGSQDPAPARVGGGAAGLPGRLRAGIEALSGTSMGDVRVHFNSPEPARRDALAYARGSEIHVGPGQGQHLAHEAWHVVQQKQGRVAATEQFKGEPLNSDAGLEREADIMGARATRWSGAVAAASTAPGPGAPVVQRHGVPVIQARKIPLHDDARRPALGRGETYSQEEQSDGSMRWFVEMDPGKYPHITEQALGAYEHAVQTDPSAQLSTAIYEAVAEGGKAFVFDETQSNSLYAIHLSAGEEIITMTPRAPNVMGGRTTKAQAVLNRTGNPRMGEADAQHVGTHYPGTPPGGTHQHFVGTGGKINLNVVSELIDRLEDEGIIGAPKVNSSGKPLKESQIDKGMADSLVVGAAVREALGVPERTAEPVDLEARYKSELEKSKKK